ncbi:NAD(P)/FAD-dependent oxidoreductase [Gordonia sp. OPL2]|uniref:NAD(P)/FAD-dependent oxidoreductase n=1 Tax=Gordonia sp. OPL2 TaxID=2486274 RepID=UPI001654C87F|nr:FAD-dependent oxidoreductase [Gordonia sp. OPL2]RPA20095.1 NAD(P)/FAD-dependent oxidoreductase [Gordonia sp. OPL2]
MSEPGLIVLGSGPAGMAAAEAFRERRDDEPVRVLTADVDMPYFRPPLSKEFLRGDTDDVAMYPSSWFTENNVDINLDTRVTEVDVHAHAVTAAGIRHPYSHLILAGGSSPQPPAIPGGELALTLRSLQDARELRDVARRASSAVVIGGGFIGCEAAASIAARGVPVTLVAPDDLPQQRRLGTEAGRKLLRLVENSGVRFVGGAHVQEIGSDAVVLEGGVTLDTDLVLAATGVAPQGDLASQAGLSVVDSRIVVDAHMSTSHPDVYAAGDSALATNSTAGRPITIEHWQDASDQGAVAGACAAGAEDDWAEVPGFWTTIGADTVKYHAWGDGYERSRLIEHDDGFTVWYEAGGAVVGVLTHNADDDYDLGEKLIHAARPAPVAM